MAFFDLEAPITIGVWHGIVKGTHNAGGTEYLFRSIDILDVYDKTKTLYKPVTWKEQGICQGLAEIGLVIEKGWWTKKYIQVAPKDS